jgi:hypothetical protein
MFDLGKLRIIRREKSEDRSFSFVGVRTNPLDRTAEFWLPQGFQSFPEGDYAATVRTFFMLYRVMRTFAERWSLREINRTEREPLDVRDVGFTMGSREEAPVLSFSKLSLLERVLSSFDELVISSILSKNARREPETFEQLSRYMHQATYLPDDVIYIEQLPGERREHHHVATDLIGIFCYIYAQLNAWMRDPEDLPATVRLHASAFAEKYLPVNSGLFVEDSFEATIAILKDTLTNIERSTPYKDEDYWQVFNAVDLFLYGDTDFNSEHDGVLWGMSDYHPVWEDICQVFCYHEFIVAHQHRALFMDSPRFANTRINYRSVYSGFEGEEENPFFFEMNGHRRHLYPDFVYQSAGSVTRAREEMYTLLEIRTEPADAKDTFREVVIRTRQPGKQAQTEMDTLRSWLEAKSPKGFPRYIGTPRLIKNGVSYSYMSARTLYGGIDGMAELRVTRRNRRKQIYIIDFKYLNYLDFYADVLSEKLQIDLLKQQAYQLAAQQITERSATSPAKIVSQFAIPVHYSSESAQDGYSLLSKLSLSGAHGRTINPAFQKAGVTVWALDFFHVAQHYVSHAKC